MADTLNNVVDLFTGKKSTGEDIPAPEPTLDGASENDGSGYTSVGNWLNTIATTYSTVKGAIDGQKNPAVKVATQSPIAAKTNYLPWVIGGAVVLVVVIVFFRK